MNEERTLSTILELQSEIRDMERELAEARRTVNNLCKRIHRDPIYKDTEPSTTLAGSRSDEFFQPGNNILVAGNGRFGQFGDFDELLLGVFDLRMRLQPFGVGAG